MVTDQMRLNFYKQMVRIRTYEEMIKRDYHADKTPAWDIGADPIPGEMHLSVRSRTYCSRPVRKPA